MRLRPPASSSDLDEARAIAERLERPAPASEPVAPAAPRYVKFGVGAGAASEAKEARPAAAATPAEPMPEAHALPETPEPMAPAAEASPLDGLTPEPPPPAETAEGNPLEGLAPEPPPSVETVEASPLDGLTSEALPAVEEPAAPSEWPEGAAAEPPEEPGVPAPFEPEPLPPAEAPAEPGGWSAGAESLVEEAGVDALIAPQAAAAPADGLESLVGDESPLSALSGIAPAEEPPSAPPPPSWDSLLGRARELAKGQAAMLIGPGGNLLAATDGWPAAGAAAIAGKLLPMVAPRLLTPDTLVPVKLAGQVLSVWRVAVGGRSVTVASLAPQELPSEVRPEIDRQLAQGSLD